MAAWAWSISRCGGSAQPHAISRTAITAQSRAAVRTRDRGRGIRPSSIDEMNLLAPHDRPREKLERLGAGALGDNELLALVLAGGSAARDALGVANDLLDRCGGLRGLTRAAA